MFVSSSLSSLLSYVLQFYLAAIADHVDPRVKSAAVPFQRPVSTGTQTYGSNPDNYPITQPMPKMTSLLQVLSQSLSSRHVQGSFFHSLNTHSLPPSLGQKLITYMYMYKRLHTCINERHSTDQARQKTVRKSVFPLKEEKWYSPPF